MIRRLALAAAFLVSLGVAVFAGAHIISAVERPPTTVTYSMQVGRRHPAVRGHRADRHAGADRPRSSSSCPGPPPPPASRSPGTAWPRYADAGRGPGRLPGGGQGVVERDRLLRRRREGQRQRRPVHQGAGPPGSRTPAASGRSTSSATASAAGWPTASPAPTRRCSTAWRRSRPTRCRAAWSPRR